MIWAAGPAIRLYSITYKAMLIGAHLVFADRSANLQTISIRFLSDLISLLSGLRYDLLALGVNLEVCPRLTSFFSGSGKEIERCQGEEKGMLEK